MAQLTNFQISLAGATWIDASSLFTVNTNPDLLPDVLAVGNSLYNILNCAIGARGRIFQPEYGSLLVQFLQEPLDQSTANKINISLLQALARWEPRITIDMSNSGVQPDFTLPGYQIRIAYSLNLNLNTNTTTTVSFSVPTNQG